MPGIAVVMILRFALSKQILGRFVNEAVGISITSICAIVDDVISQPFPL